MDNVSNLLPLLDKLATNLDARLKAVEEKLSVKREPLAPRISELERIIAEQAAEIKRLRQDVNMLDSRTVHEVRYGI